MKLTVFVSGFAAAVMLLAGSAAAQVPTPIYYVGEEQKEMSVDDISKDESAQKDDCLQKEDDCLQKDGCCDIGKGCGKGGIGCWTPICAGDPWELMPRTCQGYKVGGWFQIGYHTGGTNGDGTGMFNNYPDVVQLHQAWAFLEKECDTGGCGWDWGFRVDYLYGTDGPDTQAFFGNFANWDNPWDAGGYYGHALPQAYVDVAYNNLKARIGHFYTICGYEVVAAPGNFFYSHAFTMYNAEPFTHTGLLLEYALGDRTTLWGGWTQGWDTGFWNNGGDSFLGGFSIDVTDNITATYTTTVGDFGNLPVNGSGGGFGSDSTGYSHSIVLDVQLTERLNYVFLSDYVDNDIFMSGPGIWDKKWSIVNYLFYDITECIAAGVRYEYYEDEDEGILAPGNQPAHHVNAITAGLNIKPHANVVIRPEVRVEDFDPAADRTDQTLFGIDTVITW
jgi:hypothetical protein